MTGFVRLSDGRNWKLKEVEDFIENTTRTKDSLVEWKTNGVATKL